jgi:hypothetical protein
MVIIFTIVWYNINKERKEMTIKEFVLAQEKNLDINGWLELIEKNNFQKHEKLIIGCADSLDLIRIDHEASFIKAINI